MHSKCDKLRLLEMNTTKKEVDGSLGRPVRANGKRHMLHARNSSNTRGDHHEDGLLCLLQQRQRGLEQTHHTRGIDINMLHQVGRLHLGHFLEGGDLEDPSIGDYGIDVNDAEDGEIVHRMLGVSLGGGFDLDKDDFAAGGYGERGEGLGVLGVEIADGADDSGVGTQEILLDETFANSLEAR